MTRAFLLAPTIATTRAAAFAALLTASCAGHHAPAPAPAPVETAPAETTVVSTDILAREPNSNRSQVKHILIGWRDKAEAYGGGIDPRAQARSRADAEGVVRDIVGQLKAGADFDTLMREHSEDSGSAASGRPFTVTPDAQLVIEFRQLGLRLQPDEVGVVESDFGFHIIKRVE
jgi:hypothetical protein